MTERDSFAAIFETVRQYLLEARRSDGVWEGRLSSSPLATAVAVFALHSADAAGHRDLIHKGLHWLAEFQQADGGWGDAETLDPPNLSSTLLCYAAIRAIAPNDFAETMQKAEAWIVRRAGSMEPQRLSEAVYGNYGKDRTFAVPILTMCALAGLLGDKGWRYVKPLPFELAMLPRGFFRRLNLTVVSYALPALIAIGQVKHFFDPSRNPVSCFLRRAARRRTLGILERIQPDNGGFLEAAPLTAFVTMSLASMGLKTHPVVQEGVRFLVDTVRADGSWPIDTNLSIWCTSLAVDALLKKGPEALPQEQRRLLARWYLERQFKQVHPFTGAAAGGWGWTDRPGAVPDADDTAGALVALYRLGIDDKTTLEPGRNGLFWLWAQQKHSGGIPTFCRGWGRLEFDRSCPDITAHAMTAWQLWKSRFEGPFQRRIEQAMQGALRYLAATQQPDGSWRPLWFGNPFLSDHSNPVYGTARVLKGIIALDTLRAYSMMIEKGVQFLIQSQNADGGWGAAKGADSTIEETAIVLDVLSRNLSGEPVLHCENLKKSGLLWILTRTNKGAIMSSAPVGLYFAKLWYAEKLYPLIWIYSVMEC
jgi:squalene-hopene/tetraprenyl-beta-curcumene cyclase